MNNSDLVFGSIEHENFYTVANQVLITGNRLIRESGKTDKTGVQLVYTIHGAPVIGGLLWGYLSKTQASTTWKTAREKADRLLRHPTHLTSYRTRNPGKRYTLIDDVEVTHWGGAIRAHERIIAISGFPEKWDEACAFVIAIRMRWLSEKFVLKKIRSKRNPHLRPLLEAATWTE